MVIAYIGLGSNLGDREAHLRAALEHLKETGEVEVLEVSRLIESEPLGGPSQPPYLNGVARIRTDLRPDQLLMVLKAAERRAGRKPTGVRWGPREADLDLVLYGDIVADTPDLTVPHPRFRERSFVLGPLNELAPEIRDPVTGKTIRELLIELQRRAVGRKTARLLETVTELRDYVRMAGRNRFTIGLVPTMGAFHEGHLALMREARRTCDKVVVSLFVNPTQFGPDEDLARYPRQVERDLGLASDAGVDVVFAPGADEMYDAGARTWVEVEGLSGVLCGATRPEHFRGVTTVVAKLFHLVRPTIAFFGQKDYQQTAVLRRMVKDLDFAVELRVLPTVREEDGLALSSRNRYLSPAEREQALCLSRGLAAARAAFDEGERTGETLLAKVRNVLEATPGVEPEYVALVHPDTLQPVREITGRAVLVLAAQVGPARLIDNAILDPES